MRENIPPLYSLLCSLTLDAGGENALELRSEVIRERMLRREMK